MGQEIKNLKVEIEVREWEAMKAEAEQMKLNMRNLTDELVERVKMIEAALTYLLFRKKLRMEREVEKTHFKLICEMIDEDRNK